MARIPPIKRLTLEDFKDQIAWIGRLIQPLNDFMSSISFALNKQLTWSDNLQGEIKTVDITVNGVNDYPFYIKSLITAKALWVANCVEIASSPSIITLAVYVSWENTGNGQIKINNITGLATGKKYRLTLVTLAN